MAAAWACFHRRGNCALPVRRRPARERRPRRRDRRRARDGAAPAPLGAGVRRRLAPARRSTLVVAARALGLFHVRFVDGDEATACPRPSCGATARASNRARLPAGPASAASTGRRGARRGAAPSRRSAATSRRRSRRRLGVDDALLDALAGDSPPRVSPPRAPRGGPAAAWPEAAALSIQCSFRGQRARAERASRSDRRAPRRHRARRARRHGRRRQRAAAAAAVPPPSSPPRGPAPAPPSSALCRGAWSAALIESLATGATPPRAAPVATQPRARQRGATAPGTGAAPARAARRAPDRRRGAPALGGRARGGGGGRAVGVDRAMLARHHQGAPGGPGAGLRRERPRGARRAGWARAAARPRRRARSSGAFMPARWSEGLAQWLEGPSATGAALGRLGGPARSRPRELRDERVVAQRARSQTHATRSTARGSGGRRARARRRRAAAEAAARAARRRSRARRWGARPAGARRRAPRPAEKIDLSLRENAWDKDFAYRVVQGRATRGRAALSHRPGAGAGRRGPRAPPHLRFD